MSHQDRVNSLIEAWGVPNPPTDKDSDIGIVVIADKIGGTKTVHPSDKNVIDRLFLESLARNADEKLKEVLVWDEDREEDAKKFYAELWDAPFGEGDEIRQALHTAAAIELRLREG